MVALSDFVDLVVVYPSPSMACDFVAELDHRLCGIRISQHRHSHREYRDRNSAFFEETHQSPEAGSAAVLVDRLHAHMPSAFERRRADDLGQKGLRSRIAM